MPFCPAGLHFALSDILRQDSMSTVKIKKQSDNEWAPGFLFPAGFPSELISLSSGASQATLEARSPIEAIDLRTPMSAPLRFLITLSS